MNYKKPDSFAEKRGTFIALSIFLFIALCFSFAIDARGYFFRWKNGTKIRAGDVEVILPKGYYIDSKDNAEYTVCDIDDHNVQLDIEAWTGTPEIPKMTERIKAIGGDVCSYEIHGYQVHEFFFRSYSWREDIGGIMYLFPQQHIRITYWGSLSMMYITMNKFIQTFKRISGNSPGSPSDVTVKTHFPKVGKK
ncbi:MAG: hypothetical protein GXO69_07570 [Acidobacteria bacterium]|nr:hypothetical protein [Acidobacteriota bacterium]